jgi:queuine tRNA-ribosyltransferase
MLSFEIVARDGAARRGVIRTAHGDMETPGFFAVATRAALKGLDPRTAGAAGIQALISNGYHLAVQPGPEVVAAMGGLHRFMGWDGVLATDSGGFQVFSLSDLRKVTDQGVLFRSHLDGDAHLFTPESTVDVQFAFGSDIMMVLDECLAYPASHEAANQAMRRTVGWARAGYQHYLQRVDETGSESALFPVVQGSMFADLRRTCATELLDLDAPGYAIGGLSVGEPRALSLEMTEVTTPLLPRDRPRYVMGVGMPEELPEYVARGVDMMDCVLPSRNARNGYLFTSTGRVVIKQARYREDPAPVDANCRCYTCRTYSRAYLRHLFQAGEILFSTLATLHNLTHYLDRMRQIRQSLLLGGFQDFLDGIRGAAVE